MANQIKLLTEDQKKEITSIIRSTRPVYGVVKDDRISVSYKEPVYENDFESIRLQSFVQATGIIVVQITYTSGPTQTISAAKQNINKILKVIRAAERINKIIMK